MRFSIVIPTYRHLNDCLIPCLESIKTHTDLSDVEVIIVANGCGDDGTKEYVESLGGLFKLVWLNEPSGYTHSTNVGIQASSGEYIILLNNDCVILGTEWINLLHQPFQDPRMGITGPLKLHCPDADRDFLVFFCAMIRRTMLNEIGILDEIFSPGYGEDCDLAARAVNAGWKIQQVPDSEPQLVDKGCEDLPQWKRDKMWHNSFPLYHDGNKTFGDDPEKFDVVLNRNKKTLQERYRDKVNTPTGACNNCSGPLVDGVCVGAEGQLNCDGLYLWRAAQVDGWFSCNEGAWLARQVKSLPKGAKVCELGSWHGRSSRFIADNLPEDGQLWATDTWVGSSGEPEMHGSAHLERGDHAHQWWWCNLQEHILTGKVVPVRMHGVSAAATFASLDMKFDLIFIDASHDYESVKEDILAWSPLLKEGGIMCGHDYYLESEQPFAWIGVRQCVQELFPDAQKVATSIWWTRSCPVIQGASEREAEINYQVNEAQYDYDANPEYAQVVENAHRQIIPRLFSSVPKDAAIVDAGCGNGIALRILKELGYTNAKGVDVVADSYKWMEGLDIQKCDMHLLPFDAKTVDVIYSAHSLEHAYDPIKVLAEFRRVLKPDGDLFLILPYVDVIDSEHRAKAHCGSKPLGLTVSDNAKTLFSVLENAGFTITSADSGILRQESEIYLQLKSERPHVYDAFIYNGEEDVLEIRLATLNNVVDRFVICESGITHSGNPKPLYFEESKDRFAKYLHKINHVVVDSYPKVEGTIYDQAWARERHQRDSVMLGLQNCKPDDVVLIGDADEIASPEAVKNYDPSQGLVRLKQRLFYYYLNCENKEGWDWQKIAPYKVVKELTPCGVRYPPAGHVPLIENGGHHFSFLGNAANAIKKVSDYAHREFDTPELMNLERVESLINEGRDIFGRDLKYEFVSIDDQFPAYVRDNLTELIRKGLWRVRSPIADPEIREEIEGRTAPISSLAAKKHWTVTAEISTKDRYFTTLPLTISAIANQTRKVDKLVIYDDGEQLDLRMISPFDGLLKMLEELKIEWEIIRTPRQGQVSNHQHCLETATTDFVWRVDDDEIPTADCLRVLLNAVRDYGDGGQFDKIGAIAGLVHHPGNVSPLPEFVDGSLKDVQAGLNMQWFDFNSYPREVEHLYSTFLYRVEAGRRAGGYPKGLSTIGHREETIFTHSLKRAGYKLIVTPYARTWHLRASTGGLRAFNDQSLWEHDEKVFQSYLNEWGVSGKPTKVIVLDAGYGDHFAFLSILPKVREAHPDKDLVLAVCYPSVFDGQDVKLISIADAKNMLGERYDDYSIYKYLWDKDWKGSLSEGMLAMHS